jgi:hypothetical protein
MWHFQLKHRLRQLRNVIRAPLNATFNTPRDRDTSAVHNAKAELLPLLLAEKTYNTSHPDYKPELVGNFPDHIQHADRPCENRLFAEIQKLAKGDKVPDRVWRKICADVMKEASTVPGFDQVMERKAFIENYLSELSQRYHSQYVAGWVNLADAQFLYWIVRQAKPQTVVQTGVSNGLSTAFMMLALAKNGRDGHLYAIDMPQIFDPAEPGWTRQGTIYGVAIPQGKSSGWMVPDIYRSRFDVENGDAKILLPRLIDRLDHVNLFFHDSDHTYHHMMFEFEQAKRKLVADGLIVADDISWNSSLWDFADRLGVPSYNYLGTIGVAFLPGRSEPRDRA